MTTSRTNPITPLQAIFSLHWSINGATTRNRYRRQCPRYTDKPALADRATADALALTALVREEDPDVIFGALAEYTHEQLSVLAVALAAMVPHDRSATDLLAWLDDTRPDWTAPSNTREVIRGG